MSRPRVSAVVPNYNHAKLVPRCLLALLHQSVPPDEILVIDDASTDNSVEVLTALAAQHPRIRFLRNERNAGVHASLNRGLAEAQFERIGFFAADDEVLPGLLEKSLPLLEAHPEAGLVTGLCRWQCHSTGNTWQYGATMPRTAGFLPPTELVKLGRAGRLQVAAQPALYRRDALLQAGGWRPELRWFTDWFGTWVVGFRHGICFVPEELSVFHLYPGSYYHTAAGEAQRQETLDRLLRLLESTQFADVAPWVRQSGILGQFGMPALRLTVGRREHRQFLSIALLRLVARRQAEVVGRRFFPAWLTRLCLRLFYGARTTGATPGPSSS